MLFVFSRPAQPRKTPLAANLLCGAAVVLERSPGGKGVHIKVSLVADCSQLGDCVLRPLHVVEHQALAVAGRHLLTGSSSQLAIISSQIDPLTA